MITDIDQKLQERQEELADLYQRLSDEFDKPLDDIDCEHADNITEQIFKANDEIDNLTFELCKLLDREPEDT